ncbi:type III-B CRISPR module RAMP protein Cmr6 [Sorangium sp. So ce1024]|uniref:type III-B CRISPR module RAMP protein Cmr6 n=1 Tax=Sorangium sp. So ce1024 TaxID=3133327 RepID=UPI003F02C05B
MLPRETARKIGRRPMDGDHVGLWIDKLLPREKKTRTLRERERVLAFQQLCRSYRSELGREVLERARRAVAETHAAHRVLRAGLQGRLLVDVGRVNAVETSVSFHPVWGVPRIPGSALKGATRARMERDGVDPETIARCFGGPAAAGSLVFYDALPENGAFAIGIDVLTPHAKQYYEKKETPGDWLSPEPHTFLAVESAGRDASVFVFLVGVDVVDGDEPGERERREGQVARDLEEAVGALRRLLAEDGVGAKTVAGYGRFRTIDVRGAG